MYFKELLENHRSNKLPKEMTGCIRRKDSLMHQMSNSVTNLWDKMCSNTPEGFKWGNLYYGEGPVEDCDDC